MSRGLSRQRDVIAAISTGSGGGVGMVRLSGPGSLAAAGQVFFPQDRRKKLPELPGYTGAYGQFREGETVVDDGVLFAYRARGRRGPFWTTGWPLSTTPPKAIPGRRWRSSAATGGPL